MRFLPGFFSKIPTTTKTEPPLFPSISTSTINLRRAIIPQPTSQPQYLVSSRAFHCASRRMATVTKPVFSSGYDPELGERGVASLVKGKGDSGRWRLMAGGMGLERSFRFKTFKKTWEFMNVVAAECAVKKHHPEWSNVYNTTFIRWTTHSPPGLSEKDILMARFCDEQALAFGEVVLEAESEVQDETGTQPESAGGAGGVGKELADRVAREGGECCVPKSLRKGEGAL